MRKHFLVIMLLLCAVTVSAQRKQQVLGRGVVAVQNGGSVTVTWRQLAQEPEDSKWNIYVKKEGAADYVKINTQPLSVSNFKTNTSVIPLNSQVAVKRVSGKDGKEGELSTPFLFKSQSLRNIYMEITYQGGPLNNANYTTKYCWPVDLDGNGEYDYVVDRLPLNGGSQYLEAYLADGTYLWTVDMGPNESISSGQDDQVCAYDIDCDGYGEVIVQTSDGTRFWDKEKNTWGTYVMGKDNGDIDGDGIIDYNSQTTRNPPRYMTVINGMTGAEKASVEQMYDDAYNRTNKAALMGDEYNKHVGHVGIIYHDGIHPALVMEWHTRYTDKSHNYRNSAWAYDFDAQGNATNFHQLFMKRTGGAAFHQIRIFDADGDGRDEMSTGAYCMDHDGSTLYNTGIAHGDRHRTSDIDPERPGLETFSIQQDAGDMLGQILFDAGTGEPIKKWYLQAVGDVGRGECIDIIPEKKGWEMFSTMNNFQLYDANGDEISGKFGYFPTEGIWWDGDLGRENVNSPDGDGYNAMIVDYVNGRLIEMAKESGWTIKSSNAKRGKFWGDIIGDWREELILIREVDGVCNGIVGFTTDYTTSVNNIYCLQEDPHYRGDCTTKGYYQTPEPGFYLGYDMPRPQLPPCMRADAKNEVFDLTLGNATVKPTAGMENIYLMPVKGQTLTVDTDISGETMLWKSQLGTAILKGTNNSTATTIISEGTLQVDGTIAGTVDLRARGTLSGAGIVNAITLEGALHYEGGRVMPTGVMTIQTSLNIDKRAYFELDIDKGYKVKVNGDLAITAPLVFTINTATAAVGTYPLLEYSGNFSGDMANCSIRGLAGISYNIVNEAGKVSLVINDQRAPAENVVWTGAQSALWDYHTDNWSLDGTATKFVAEDGIVFDESAAKKSITVSELMPFANMEVNSTSTYTFNGEGGLSGNGTLVKNGTGRLVLNTTKSDYTGATIINSGTVQVKELADAGTPSSFGAASAAATNLKIGKATLIVTNASTSTNRGITLTDTATVNIQSGATSLSGLITGTGVLKKIGNGQLNITYGGQNSWNGTILQTGTLAMGSWNTTFGRPTSRIHVTGNCTLNIFNCNSTSTVPYLQNAIEIDANRTLTLNAGRRCKIGGSLSGKGTLKISFPYVRGDVSTNASAFEGTYDVLTTDCRFVNGMDFSKAILKLESGSYAAGFRAGSGTEASYTHKVGSLQGSGTLGTGVWNIGYRGANDTFGGTINANATINKYGEGAWNFTGTANGPVNVRDGIVDGSGTFNNINVFEGGTLGAGKTGLSTLQTLNVTGTLTMNAGSSLRIRTRSNTTTTKGDAFKVNGAVKLNSPKFVITSLSGEDAYEADREIQVFTGSATVTLTGDITFEPAVPKDGLKWDASTLTQDGIIRIVKDANFIHQISASELDADDIIHDLSGRQLSAVSKPGLYIINGVKVYVK